MSFCVIFNILNVSAQNVAPDLISSNINIDSISDQRAKPPNFNEHHKYIRQRARSSYIGSLNENLPKNAWTDPLTSTYQRRELQRTCAVCLYSKPLLSEESTKQFHASPMNYDLLQSLKENIDTLENHEQTDCTCPYNFQTFLNSQNNRRFRYEINRMPRSAPHITFMEV